MLKHKINLSLLAQDSTPIINLVQMDTGRELECTITDFSIPVGATAKLWVIKPSGKIVSANGAIDGNIITVVLSDQQVVESGLAVAQLKISSAGKIISSFFMYLNFQEDASMNGIISTEDIKLVDAFLQEQSKKLDDAIALKTAQIQKNTQDVTTLKEDLTNHLANHPSGEVGGNGLTKAQVEALEGMFKVTAFSADPTSAYATFKTAFGIGGTQPQPEPPTPSKTLQSISAVYNGGDVSVGTALTDLTGLAVTAHYSDGSSNTVTDYQLSGSIAKGSNTITVTYQSKETTFVVNGVEQSVPQGNGWVNGQPYDCKWIDGQYIDPQTDELKPLDYFSTTDFLPCQGINRINGTETCMLYDNLKKYIGKRISLDRKNIAVMKNAYFVRFNMRTDSKDSITPYFDEFLTDKTAWKPGAFYQLNWKDGYLLDSTGNNEQSNSAWSLSDFALCYGATHYLDATGTRHWVYWYDSNKKYISHSLIQNITTGVDIPPNTHYFRTVTPIAENNLWVKLT